MEKTPNRKEDALKILGAFIIGAVFLSILSLIQKIIAGFNPFMLKGYFIPVLFGGMTGASTAHGNSGEARIFGSANYE